MTMLVVVLVLMLLAFVLFAFGVLLRKQVVCVAYAEFNILKQISVKVKLPLECHDLRICLRDNTLFSVLIMTMFILMILVAMVFALVLFTMLLVLTMLSVEGDAVCGS